MKSINTKDYHIKIEYIDGSGVIVPPSTVKSGECHWELSHVVASSRGYGLVWKKLKSLLEQEQDCISESNS